MFLWHGVDGHRNTCGTTIGLDGQCNNSLNVYQCVHKSSKQTNRQQIQFKAWGEIQPHIVKNEFTITFAPLFRFDASICLQSTISPLLTLESYIFHTTFLNLILIQVPSLSKCNLGETWRKNIFCLLHSEIFFGVRHFTLGDKQELDFFFYGSVSRRNWIIS